MGRKVKKDRTPAAPALPVAVMPQHLIVYEPADWLPDDAPPEPVDGYDVPAWEAFEAAHSAAYQRHLAARREWEATHQQPPLVIDELPGDEPFTPPPNKVDRNEYEAIVAAVRPPSSSYRPSAVVVDEVDRGERRHRSRAMA